MTAGEGPRHASNVVLHAQGDWGTQFGMLIQHLDDSREGGLAGGAADEDVKDLQARLWQVYAYPNAEQGWHSRMRETLDCRRGPSAWQPKLCPAGFLCGAGCQPRQAACLIAQALSNRGVSLQHESPPAAFFVLNVQLGRRPASRQHCGLVTPSPGAAAGLALRPRGATAGAV